MRPLRLVVEGFTSFRGKQEIALEGLELFAISGPTGSGKSSILDAMMYALFGEIPRLGGQGYQEIISHGAPRLAVTLDFEVGARIYRAVRTLRRRGQTSAQLVELDRETRDEGPAIADSVRDVDRRVEEMLGLTYKTFAQAVVLPQGEFQRFLKAPPRERRSMLSTLLRLGRYDVARKAAQKRYDDAAHLAESIERRLSEDFACIEEAAIAAMAVDLEERTKLVAALHTQEIEAARDFEAAREVARTTEELRKKTVEQEMLAARREAIDRARTRLAAARQASALRDILQSLGRARHDAAASKNREEKAREDLRKATERVEAISVDLERATNSAAELPSLTARIGELDQVIGIQTALLATEKQLTRAESEARDADRQLAAVRERLATATKSSSTAEKTLRDAAAARESVGYSPERASWLRELVPAARAVVDQTTRLDETRAELAELAKARAVREKARDGAGKIAAQARDDLKTAVARMKEADESLRAEERRNHAAFLRRGLEPGDSCPVCEQPVKKHPPVPRGADQALQRATAALTEARAHEERARAAAEAANGKLTRAETALQETLDRIEKIEKQAVDAEMKLGTLAAKLAKDVREATIEPALPADAAGIIEEDAELERRQATWEKLQKQHRDAERAHDLAVATARQLTADETSARSALDSATRRRDETLATRDAQRAEVEAVAGDADPRAAKQALQRRAESLGNELTATREAHREADTALRLATKEHADAASRAGSTATELAELEATIASRAAGAGFADEAAARAAALDDATMSALERETREYDAESEVLAREVAALRAELGERRATADDVVARQRELEVAQEAHGAAVRARADVAAKLEIARRDLAKASSLRVELDAARRDAEVYGTLAKELQTDRFLEYLLAESQQKLVAGASLRLKELSDRYTLETRDGQFYVVDHDNASEQRSVDTLSGGETFLTSLALALELSAQIQATAGATQLDSIFIDEGFGTLDPETLETVASAIESLPHAGRMVGIVTHVAELTERMPARVQVVKSADGSRIRVGDQG